MGKANSVKLRLEITELDAKNIIRWLDNKEVSQYLNEDVNELSSLQSLIDERKTNMLTYRLNQDGRFFMIDSNEDFSLGFINLFTIKPNKEYEVVIVIGDPSNWGKQYGLNALKTCMRTVFIQWRIDKLNALIEKENVRSLNMFEHMKFNKEYTNNKYVKFTMNFNEYLANPER